jgi:multidrug efflux pump subunit AcrA (membrane-fusion protein)
MIPKSAIIGDSTVAVVNDDNLVDMKSVSIASDTGGYVLIMDGLAEGDRVITDPPKSLDMGMQVDVK